ncbi:MAG: MFS transporter, partial [Bacillota bacterium]
SGGFWSYLKEKELSYFPTGALRWWILILLILAWTTQQFDSYKMGPVLVYLLDEFKINLTQWGYLAAGAGSIASLLYIYLGGLSDKYGRRRMMIVPLLLYIPIAIAVAIAPSFGVFAVFYTLSGAMLAGMYPATLSASRDITPQMGRGMVFAWISLAFTVGALLANWMASWTIPIWAGWRPQFYIAAVLTGIIALLVIAFFRDLSLKVRGQIVKDQMDALGAAVKAKGFSNIEDAMKRGGDVLKDWRIWTVSAAMIFWAVPYVSVGYYVPLYLNANYGIEPTQAAVVTSWFWVIFTISVFISGWLSDRMRVRKTVSAFGGITTGIMFFISASLPQGTSFSTLALSWSITGFFSGFIYPAWCAIISENAEEISPFGVARAFSVSGFLGIFSQILLNLGMPRVVAAYGWPTWMGPISAISCFMIVVCIATARGPWWIPKETSSSASLHG